ncbi:hypothetical protein Glove_115g96 [Diversispora epigaea]|uniref:Uncharacterized protein n=1 Tax=Diversispora epigaea TaxID=1348612 RepID=A0A397JB39_9GLOM|nr:hypothetical protein Glove_115g96 [Diversispora epigaea]
MIVKNTSPVLIVVNQLDLLVDDTKAIYPLCEEAEFRVSNSCKAKKSGIRLKPFIINLKLKTINENLEFWLDSTKAIYPLCEEAEFRVSNSCKAKKSGIRLVRFG